MKVAFLIISDQFAGAENVVGELAKNMAKTKTCEVAIICNSELVRHYSNLGSVNVISIGKTSRKSTISLLFSYLVAAFRLRHYIQSKDIDLIHLNLTASIIVSRLAGVRGNQDFVITLHGGEIKQFIDSVHLSYRRLVRPLVSSMLKSASQIITISDWQVEKLEKKYKANLIKIPNGVDVQNFRPRNKVEQKLTILYVGRMIEEKGIKEALAVARNLPQLEFWFVGAGPLSEIVKGENVRCLGYIAHEKLVDIYNVASICIFPSYCEPFSCAGLEAMACARPIICTPKGFTEYVEDGIDGVVVEPESAVSLQCGIESLVYDRRLRHKLATKAREKALQYDWEKITQQYLMAFYKIIAAKERI